MMLEDAGYLGMGMGKAIVIDPPMFAIGGHLQRPSVYLDWDFACFLILKHYLIEPLRYPHVLYNVTSNDHI